MLAGPTEPETSVVSRDNVDWKQMNRSGTNRTITEHGPDLEEQGVPLLCP